MRPLRGDEAPEVGFAACLAGLPGMGPSRLRALLAGAQPSGVWEALAEGGHPLDPDAKWQEHAAVTDVGAVWSDHTRAGVGIVLRGSPGYPERLALDPEGPAVLFHLGDLEACGRHPTVCIVGTRSASRYGLGVAAQFGAELASVGVSVVSGLALGIDGAAHEGSWGGWRSGGPGAAPPIGVVAGGLDRPYPARHRTLWQRVAEAGALLSETPVGAGQERWRFPARNRVLAALADLVVVVECHASGGAMHTVAAAAKRGVPVGAVPGSIRSPASSGTNGLLADGCFPVRDCSDILVALELAGAGRPVVGRHRSGNTQALGTGAGEARVGDAAVSGTASGHPSSGDTTAVGPTAGARPAGPAETGQPDETGQPERSVLQAMEWEPCSVDQLLRRTGLGLGDLSMALERLVAKGTVVEGSGWWSRV